MRNWKTKFPTRIKSSNDKVKPFHAVFSRVQIMHVELKATERAEETFEKLIRGHKDLGVFIDDQGCCGFSNVFVREKASVGPDWVPVGKIMGVDVYVSAKFVRFLGQTVRFDVVESEADDSFSLETLYGVRFIISTLIPPVVEENG